MYQNHLIDHKSYTDWSGTESGPPWLESGLHTYILTPRNNSPSWEANRFSSSQEIPCILWNSNVHHRIHKWSPRFPILSQLDTVHVPTSHFLKIHFNIILPSTPESSKWALFLRFPHQNPVNVSPLPIRAASPAHLIFLDFITRKMLGKCTEYRVWLLTTLRHSTGLTGHANWDYGKSLLPWLQWWDKHGDLTQIVFLLVLVYLKTNSIAQIT